MFLFQEMKIAPVLDYVNMNETQILLHLLVRSRIEVPTQTHMNNREVEI